MISSLQSPIRESMAVVPIKLHVHDSIADAAELMAENDIGAAPVILDNESMGLAGIISERDVVRSIVDGGDPTEERVGDWMTVDVLAVEPTETIERATAMMLDGGIRHLPVVENGSGHRRIVGMLSVRDLLAAHAALAALS
jgi:CBS domain-containing protein